jgi:hypothetical protein
MAAILVLPLSSINWPVHLMALARDPQYRQPFHVLSFSAATVTHSNRGIVISQSIGAFHGQQSSCHYGMPHMLDINSKGDIEYQTLGSLLWPETD